jgi:hypothetical protein
MSGESALDAQAAALTRPPAAQSGLIFSDLDLQKTWFCPLKRGEKFDQLSSDNPSATGAPEGRPV